LEQPSGLWYWWGIMVLSYSKLERLKKSLQDWSAQLNQKGWRWEPDPVPGGGISPDVLWVYAVVDDKQWSADLPEKNFDLRRQLNAKLVDEGLISDEDWVQVAFIPQRNWKQLTRQGAPS
jgi:hypothetical protein